MWLILVWLATTILDWISPLCFSALKPTNIINSRMVIHANVVYQQ